MGRPFYLSAEYSEKVRQRLCGEGVDIVVRAVDTGGEMGG
jgi:hypothetical protein